jgi:hypothetical protein
MDGFNNTQAMTEGWAISACTGVEEDYRLEKMDEMSVFESDREAWIHVARRALNGSTYHIRALKFLEVNEPVEFENIENEACLRLGLVSLTHLFAQLNQEA